MGDNTVLKDALSNEYSLRVKDISAAQDGSLRRSMILSTAYPVDYGSGGIYHRTSKSGIMAAGLAAAAPIYAFRNPSASLLALVRRVRLTAWTDSVGFAAGVVAFDMFVARAFTAQDTGGLTPDLTGNNSKLRTSMASASVSLEHSSTAALTAGTRTLDVAPVESLTATAPTTAYTSFNIAPLTLFERLTGEHALMLAQNEGFVIQATVPATGTWHFAVTPEWDEVPLAQY